MELKLHYERFSYQKTVKWIENTINHHSLFICDPFFWCLNPIFSFSLAPQWQQRGFALYKLLPVTCTELAVHQGSRRWKASNAKCSKTVNISVAFCYGRLSGFSSRFLDACGGSVDAGYLSLGQDDSTSRWLTSVWKSGTNDTLIIWNWKVE